MLVHEGSARTDRIDERLAWSFAAIAGALNAAGFYAFGTYSANMTGNVSSLADHLGLCHAEPPRPILPLPPEVRADIVSTVERLNLA